ncbi:hypothetical protein EGW08_009218, partial [Elysia chlorotica]
EGSTRALLAFEDLLPAGGGEYTQLFSGFTPPDVPVLIDDSRTFTCVIEGDPHVRQVDSRRHVDLYEVGTFTAYESTRRDFQVQIRTWPCTRRQVSCVCGVTVREGNDVIRINQCDQIQNIYASPVVSVANQLHPGTEIKRSGDGKKIEVLLASGSSIKISSRWNMMTLSITTPGTDR